MLVTPQEHETTPMPLPQVLLVDDTPAVCRALRRLLAAHAEVEIAQSVKEARTLIDGHPFDVVITDYHLPQENGLRLLEFVRRRLPGTTRVLLSARPRYLFNAPLLSGLVHHYFQKPVLSADLVSCITATSPLIRT